MLDLSLTKLLIILVVGALLAGPARLPGLARQTAGIWRRLNDTRSALDRELRATMPDLPASRDLVRYARSPVALMDRLARMESPGPVTSDGPTVGGPGVGGVSEPAATVAAEHKEPVARPTFAATSTAATKDLGQR